MDDSKVLASFLIVSVVVTLFVTISHRFFRRHTENVGLWNDRVVQLRNYEKVAQIHLDTPLWHCVSLTYPAEFTLSPSRVKFDPVDVHCKCDMLGEAACWHEAKYCYYSSLVFHSHKVRGLMKDGLENNVCNQCSEGWFILTFSPQYG